MKNKLSIKLLMEFSISIIIALVAVLLSSGKENKLNV
jgi:hypothetical protein